MATTLDEPISDTGGAPSDDGGLVSTQWTEYDVDVEGTRVTTTGDTSTDGGAASDTGALATETSPISQWLQTSKWNRQDVELALTATSVFASVVVMILLVTNE